MFVWTDAARHLPKMRLTETVNRIGDVYMNETKSTIRELLVEAEKKYHAQDAFRYKVKGADESGKKAAKIESKSYTQLKDDSERFSAALAALGEQGKHIAIIGPTSYSWVVTYFGTVDSVSVAVPLDANLPDANL